MRVLVISRELYDYIDNNTNFIVCDKNTQYHDFIVSSSISIDFMGTKVLYIHCKSGDTHIFYITPCYIDHDYDYDVVADIDIKLVKRTFSYAVYDSTLYKDGCHKSIIQKLGVYTDDYILGSIYSRTVEFNICKDKNLEECIVFSLLNTNTIYTVVTYPNYMTREEVENEIKTVCQLNSEDVVMIESECEDFYSVLETRGVDM